MSAATPHRIDPPSLAKPRISGARRRSIAEPTPNSAPSGRNQSDDFPAVRVDSPHGGSVGTPEQAGDGATHPSQWLGLHAAELVERLQAWASDLDAREAQLNARTSLQDHRERRFRLQQQDKANALAEQQRSLERLRKELQAQARRLAFKDES